MRFTNVFVAASVRSFEKGGKHFCFDNITNRDDEHPQFTGKVNKNT